jgi:protein-tyrosine phosphatase
MKPDVFWIPGPWPGRLAITGRPRGGDWLEAEVDGWGDSGVDVVLSLLEVDEAEQLGLKDERLLAESKGLQFLSFPIPDRGVPPSTTDAMKLLAEVTSALGAGRNVAVHCRQSVGRAGLIAAAALIIAGLGTREAVDAVSGARGLPVPETSGQLQWLKSFAVERVTSGETLAR